ncbi:hypothetical protein CesoFtcFv8_011706 [Champsocephalus esox]|uniref:Uncharacterized protein n=1 Tax=Champsocephalus esox TaxID=159716 RepID=A0AAN8GX09_9TELE|nr:hypothetical protein CesoFtcFv8_011706 [Champsocephalus esox]
MKAAGGCYCDIISVLKVIQTGWTEEERQIWTPSSRELQHGFQGKDTPERQDCFTMFSFSEGPEEHPRRERRS